MARSTLEVIVKVKDAASKPLDDAEKKLRRTGKAARDVGADFTQFNKTMFATTAFVNLFSRAFDKIFQSIDVGSGLSRLEDQFDRVVGPRGTFLKAISGLTDNSIDRMEALKQGISLRSLGIVKNMNQLADVTAKAGTAAKLAGMDSAEGIRAYSEFLKTGSVSNLQFLNLIAESNPQLKIQMAMLQKVGGVMGGVISQQARLALGQKLLNAATENQLKGQRDLRDVVLDVKQAVTFLSGEIGEFLGKAFIPLLEKVKDAADDFKGLLERIGKNSKGLLTLTKNIVLVTGSLTALIATIGTLRLAIKALGFLGIGGIPFLALSLIGLATAFTDVQGSIGKFLDKIKAFGAVLLGVGQLVSSFILDSENFAKGVGKMDKNLYKFLQERGLLKLTELIAKLSSVIILFVRDVGNQLLTWIDGAAKAVEKLTGFFNKLFGMDKSSPWARGLIENGNLVRDTIVKLTATVVALYGAFKLLSLGKGLLSKIPGLGGLFGGGGIGGGPRGTKTDPLYVTPTVGGLGGAAGALGDLGGIFGGGAGKGGRVPGKLGKLGGLLGKVGGKAGLIGVALSAAGLMSTLMDENATTADKVGAGAGVAGSALGGWGGAALGAAIGTAILPGLGTAIGGALGGLGGSIGLGAIFENLGKKITEAVQTGTGDKRSTVAIPAMPEAEEAKIGMIGAQLEELQGDKRKQFQAAVEGALSTNSAGGATITPEEWMRIFVLALDSSENLSRLVKKAEEPETSSTVSSRRMGSVQMGRNF